MTARPWKFDGEALLIAVRASPKASRDAIEGVRIDADGQAWLQVKVRAVPESGGANAAIIALLAKRLRAKRSAVALVSGATARLKRFRITGLADDLDQIEAVMTGSER